uniref:Uncharacterized protein n=1 Tax=Rhizophora mucronata TaxID=61149 RepID=A0A2P2IU28_RHIMU
MTDEICCFYLGLVPVGFVEYPVK